MAMGVLANTPRTDPEGSRFCLESIVAPNNVFLDLHLSAYQSVAINIQCCIPTYLQIYNIAAPVSGFCFLFSLEPWRLTAQVAEQATALPKVTVPADKMHLLLRELQPKPQATIIPANAMAVEFLTALQVDRSPALSNYVKSVLHVFRAHC